MSTSIQEIIESAGYNPRNPDDAIRLTAILDEDEVEHLREIIDNTIELDYNRQQVEQLTEQLGELSTGSEDREDRQNLMDEIDGYRQTIDELIKEGEKLWKYQ